MAAANTAKSLQDEASCSICLDYFTDPVITDCGHSFCRSCITLSWKGLDKNFPCPHCRAISQQRKLKSNRQLANMTEIAKKLSRYSEKWPEEILCEEHEEKLKLFCEEDQKLICMVCDKSRNHKSHTVIPIEEAVQEYKEKFTDCLKPLRKKLEAILTFKSSEEKKAQELMSETENKRQKIVSEFEDLHQFLSEQKQILLVQLKEEEQKILQRIGENVTQLEKQSSSLMQLISEIEGKCQQPATELLKDVKDTLSRCQKGEFPKPEAVSIEMKKYFQLSYPRQYIILKKLITKFGELHFPELEWWMRFGKNTVDVTLDPETAHPELVLSEDRKSVRHGDRQKNQKLLDNPQRFDTGVCVLGCESFTLGRHYWEVEVGDKTRWDLGVCKDSVSKKGTITITPGDGYWAVRLRDGDYWALTSPSTELPLTESPRAVGILLDCKAGKVSFYNADEKSHLFTFTDTLREKLRPYFCPGVNRAGKNAGILKIRPVSDWE
ncbi:E3 ubiquitin-protein ligase TRIM39-like [Rhinatrema bivittatum]|uniref:E3 ubiquitin-protein ligase TRIM39-like n=1 Tax=Rhinatrema bivittatum TaxID=194408 RepID=UPI00112C5DF1|nr:E3 ubiquitin-protein ligase TRIM39-like [Rhinatrema bivittatum]